MALRFRFSFFVGSSPPCYSKVQDLGFGLYRPLGPDVQVVGLRAYTLHSLVSCLPERYTGGSKASLRRPFATPFLAELDFG